MSWSVDKLWGFTTSLLNKPQSGNLTPSMFFYAFNSQQRLYMADIVGRFQARNTGKAGANTGLIQNEVDLTKLSPFTKPVTLTVTAGNANKPADFIYRLAARINDKEVIFIDKGQIAFVINSVIEAPSVSMGRYYATEYEGYYQVLPSIVTSMDLDYIADVVDVVYATIPDGNGRPIYDPANSTNPLWDNLSLMEIVQRTLKPYGVHFTSADFENYGREAINTGN